MNPLITVTREFDYEPQEPAGYARFLIPMELLRLGPKLLIPESAFPISKVESFRSTSEGNWFYGPLKEQK